ncbi:MAG TPA: magnesium transporter [Thermohalobaculum sp.]|nr:magnesium transporter [Thermohalobaculum sp.]
MTDPRPDEPDTPAAAPEPPIELRDDEYALDHARVERIVAGIEARDRQAILAEIADLHVADIADLLEQIDEEARRGFIELVWGDLDPELLVEVEEGVRDDILAWLPPDQLAEAARELETDDVVYLVEDLEADARQAVLDALAPRDRAAVTQSLRYPEYTAGRLMQSEFVKAPPFWTVGQTIDFLRAHEDLPEQFYDVVIVDPTLKPVGTVGLGKILANRRPVTLDALMEEDPRTLHVEDEQEKVAYAFNQYHLVSAPVVNDEGRVVGVITIDDAMAALQEEAEEDIRRLAGVGDEEISDSVREITWQRFPWLAVNLLTAIIASLVISIFEDVLTQVVALAILMPIVASMGGNAGTQTLTVAVRGLATRDLTSTNAARVISREGLAGLMNGIAFAIIMGGLAWAWFGNPTLGAVIAVAMVINMLIAGLAGILIPMGLEKAGADPALASGTFVTTVTDVVGFFAFLGLAGAVLL